MQLTKARKEHTCTECGNKILKGEDYWRSDYDKDNPEGTVKEHPNCYNYDDKAHRYD